MNFVDMILFHARTIPEQQAIGLVDGVATYRRVGQGILSAERRLTEGGAKPGDLVGIEIDNPIRHLVLICALYRLGIASLSLRAGGDGSLDGLGITVVLKDRPGGHAIPARVEIVDDSWFVGPPAAGGGGKGFANPSEVCRIMLSSGTTGEAKPLVFSAADIEARMIAYALRLATPGWERMLCMPGLSTNFGFSFAIAALWLGRRVSFTPAADTALQLIARYGLDFIVASPQQLQALVEVQTQAPMPCGSLRVIHVGGSILTNAFINQVRARLCTTVICAYGATEVGTVAYASADQLRGIDGAVGFVAPWAQVEILDETGAPRPRGQEGTLRIRAEGQSRSPDGLTSTASNFRDGWFYPGDLARLTEDGILVITGRSAQLINAGGVKLNPELIEEHLQAHPDIADAGALGMIGGAGIEEIWVAIVPRRDIAAEAVIDYCRQRNPNMAPRQVKFVAGIPRNALGKVVREALKHLLMA
jgi:acyl-coenzyme A synthetase/AMP-(fatty) acid ligase